MSKAVLMSIKKEWCDLIFSGKKTVEVRKRAPLAIDDPYTVYVYETKGYERFENESYTGVKRGNGAGAVIGQFTCKYTDKKILPYPAYQKELPRKLLDAACLTYSDLHRYVGSGNEFSALHITRAIRYDKPKPLNDFYRWLDDGDDIRPCANWKKCDYEFFDYSENAVMCAVDGDGTGCPFLRVQRAPQSWCYVEELKK